MKKAEPFFGLGKNPKSFFPESEQRKLGFNHPGNHNGMRVGSLRSPAKLLQGPLQGNAEHSDVRTLIVFTIPQNRPTKIPSHPWKASATAAKIVIASGHILGIRYGGSGGKPWYITNLYFAGSEITISSNGYIYAIIDVSDQVIGDGADIGGGVSVVPHSQVVGSVTVAFNSSPPSSVSNGSGDQIVIPIAQVEYNIGVASVVDQILTYNPIMSFETVALG